MFHAIIVRVYVEIKELFKYNLTEENLTFIEYKMKEERDKNHYPD